MAVACLVVAAWHRNNDGLWFQGDAPLHAVNGLFWWDLLTMMPRDPVEFTARYYARYPVINPVGYPPLFYVIEGAAFATFGPSPHVARSIVLLFAGMMGVYTVAWARRWVGPVAGWAGVFLAFIPGIVVWSNTVMLNIPVTALGLASLYHSRRWSESGSTTQLIVTALFLAAVPLTYFQGAVVLCVCAAWALLGGRIQRDRKALWIAGTALVAFVPLVAALLLAPVQATRHLPTLASLTQPAAWTFYWAALPDLVSGPLLVLGSVSLVAGLATARWRKEAAYVVTWIATLILIFSLLPARDPRYILLVAPAFALAATIGLAAAADSVPRLPPAWQAIFLAAGLAAGFWSATRVPIPNVSGFRDLAIYLQHHGPKDAVLYDGNYDHLLGFYVRALDPQFERRLVRSDKLLYEYGPATTFEWVQKSHVSSTDDVLTLLRTKSGCRWVAIEVQPAVSRVPAKRLLRQAVAGPEFQLVRSFFMTGAATPRVDLYRMIDPVNAVVGVDFNIPSFSNRAFVGIAPITR